MGLIKEPQNVDLSNKSKPWTDNELRDFRRIMQLIKAKNARKKAGTLKKGKRKKQTA
jgi:hypothetical protein